MAAKNATPLTLRITDQETARVVAIHDARGRIVGSACLVDSEKVISCKHVIRFALGRKKQLKTGAVVRMTLIGVIGSPECSGEVLHFLEEDGPGNDLCLLRIADLSAELKITPVEFIAPLRHGRKSFSVLGFPGGDPQGRNSIGVLQAADAKGLVQMDSEGNYLVEGGFSGAPVWSSDLGGFVGLVVTELNEQELAWCIPSRTLSAFCRDLLVRFRVAEADRPRIHDYSEDDPNLLLFGPVSETPTRRFTARISKTESRFRVDLKYETLDGDLTKRGGYVTFVTHPSFINKNEDAYELFSSLDKNGVAENYFWTRGSFTVAAVGDAGDTSLTIDLSQVRPKPRNFN